MVELIRLYFYGDIFAGRYFNSCFNYQFAFSVAYRIYCDTSSIVVFETIVNISECAFLNDLLNSLLDYKTVLIITCCM